MTIVFITQNIWLETLVTSVIAVGAAGIFDQTLVPTRFGRLLGWWPSISCAGHIDISGLAFYNDDTAGVTPPAVGAVLNPLGVRLLMTNRGAAQNIVGSVTLLCSK